MIERYTLAEMGQIWSLQNRFQRLLDVEKAVAQVQGKLKLIPKDSALAIVSKGSFDVERVAEIEKTTKHDVIAFVSNVAENVGEHGRFVHFGLTSSDVLDTAISLQIREAGALLDEKLAELEKALCDQAKKHKETLCAGRTHGMHAVATTLGFKLAGFLAELRRNRERVKRACSQACVVKLSGAVGTYASLGAEVEKGVAAAFDLPTEDIATQVIPRDRHAEVMTSLAVLGAGLERLAVEIRHLQRTEVGEAEEPFAAGQKGSSAMPHKRNPIASENVTGLSRLLRGYAVAALEDVALWHERDISHSSVERVIFPDAFIIAHYAANRMAQVIKNLRVYEERMLQNMELSQGQIFSAQVLLELVKGGFSREEAYALVQGHSHNLKKGQGLKDSLLSDKKVTSKVTSQALEKIFKGDEYKKAVGKLVEGIL